MVEDTRDGIVRGKDMDILGWRYLGQFYPIPAVQEEDFEEIEKYLRTKRRNPLATLQAEVDRVKANPKLVEMLVDRAWKDMRKDAEIDDKIGRSEVKDYLDTREGTIRSLWLAMKRQQPGLTIEEVSKMFSHVSTAEAMKRRDEASAEIIERGLALKAPAQPPAQPATQAATVAGAERKGGKG